MPAALLTFVLPGLASAAEDPGGTAAPEPAVVSTATCADGRAGACGPGRRLTFGGSALDGVTKVVFRGAAGAADDRAAAPGTVTATAVTVTVPATARTGAVSLIAPGGEARAEPVTLDPPKARPASADFVFPVRGRHRIGTTAVQRFGGARGHEGQDVFARCGVPVVANVAGTVKLAEFQGAAGNYVVVDGADGRSYAFMHLRRPASVAPGDAVYAGEPLGEVGDTGRASGCHLHFELWTSPGYYEGGHPVDPLGELRAWEKAAAAKARRARKARKARKARAARAAFAPATR